MNVVDSSGWLEYFADGPNAGFFTSAIESVVDLVVPTITLYEVYKRVLSQRDETATLQAIAHMHQGTIAELDGAVALNAARISIELNLPMADSIILATARHHEATLWTQDADFKGLPDVRYVEKR